MQSATHYFDIFLVGTIHRSIFVDMKMNSKNKKKNSSDTEMSKTIQPLEQKTKLDLLIEREKETHREKKHTNAAQISFSIDCCELAVRE